MAKLLCYTSPARGHLFPLVPVLRELIARGHDVSLKTLSSEMGRLVEAGVRVSPVDPAIEALPHDDWSARSPSAALERAARVFVARAGYEVADLQRAIETERPGLLIVDFNCWGAAAVAERSGLPWALAMPYFLPWRLPGVPPFGPGLAPSPGWIGRARDGLAGALVRRILNKNLPALNGVRARLGLPPLWDMWDAGRSAPRIIYFTAEPFEYASRARPSSVVCVGPCSWDPPAETPAWLASATKPVVLVTCSTEFQDDGRLVEIALEALSREDVFVVATTGGVDPASIRAPGNARIERFVPHGPILQRAVVVVCHGGMGITQKALAAGVPVCAVPFGRDQFEVARHLDVANAGTRLPAHRLTPARLRVAVAAARSRRAGAARVSEAFRAAGGATAAANALESLVLSGTSERAP